MISHFWSSEYHFSARRSFTRPTFFIFVWNRPVTRSSSIHLVIGHLLHLASSISPWPCRKPRTPKVGTCGGRQMSFRGHQRPPLFYSHLTTGGQGGRWRGLSGGQWVVYCRWPYAVDCVRAATCRWAGERLLDELVCRYETSLPVIWIWSCWIGAGAWSEGMTVGHGTAAASWNCDSTNIYYSSIYVCQILDSTVKQNTTKIIHRLTFRDLKWVNVKFT